MPKTNERPGGQRKRNRGLKIFFIVLISLVVLLCGSFYLLLIPLAKKKIISYVENNSSYTLRINSILFTGINDIEILGVELRPKLEIKEFYIKDPTERDWISLKVKLSLENIDWKALLREERIYADQVSIKEADLYVYRDKRIKDGPYKYKPLPGSLLREAKFSMTFPIIYIENSRVEYNEKSEKGLTAKIFFGKLGGTLTHLSTDSVYIATHPDIVLKGKGLIMDTITANLIYKFSVKDKNDHFSFEGHTGPFSASLFNECIASMSDAEIEEGNIQRVDLFFQANNTAATGKFDMDYTDLKVDLSAKKKDKDKPFVMIFLNKDDKKFNGKEKKPGEIDCTRDQGTSVFNFWWRALRSGIISSVVKIELPPKRKKK